MHNKVLYPPEIQVLLESNLSYSSSDKEQTWQGADFIFEEKVKIQKSIAPKGIVSVKVWQYISRLVDKIENLDKKNKILLELKSRNDESKHVAWKQNYRVESFVTSVELYYR